jgi:hypothetical protein
MSQCYSIGWHTYISNLHPFVSQTLLSFISVLAGFLGKSAWDLYWKRKQERESIAYKKRLEFVERQLSNFYWPIYLRLQKDNVVWERLLDRDHDDPVLANIARTIEANIILPNHAEIVNIIETNMHLARADEAFEQQLLQYVRHISVYQSMRQAGVLDRDPLALGEPWPPQLFPMLEQRTEALQAEYDRLLKRDRSA